MKIEKNLFINSLAVLVLTYLISQMLHESAHALTGWFLGSAPVLHHNYVKSGVEMDVFSRILIAGMGPLYSLMQAVLCFVIVRRYKKSDMGGLFWTWMMLWGYIGFFGYVLMTPFFKYGDTGFVAEQLGISGLGRLGIGTIGISAFFFISTISFRSFAGFWRSGDKKVFYNNLIFFPLMTGVVVNTLLNLPAPTFLSLLAPLCMPWCVMMVYGKLLSRKDLQSSTAIEADKLYTISKPVVVALAVVLLINRLLVFGITL